MGIRRDVLEVKSLKYILDRTDLLLGLELLELIDDVKVPVESMRKLNATLLSKSHELTLELKVIRGDETEHLVVLHVFLIQMILEFFEELT